MVTGKATIRQVSEARRREATRISSSIDRARRAAKQAEAKRAIAQREAEKQKEAATAKIRKVQERGRRIDIALGRLEPTRGPVAIPTSIFQQRGVGPAIAGATANRYQQRALTSIVLKAQTQGISSAKDVKISGLSRRAFELTQQFARTTRKGAPILQEKVSVISPTTGKIIRYPVESVVRGAEMAGMLPGGIEVLARRPKTIVPALAVGVVQTGLIGEAIEADPKQFVSDIVTLGILIKGAGKAPKVIKKTPAQLKKLAVEEAAQLGRVKVKTKIETSFERTFKEAMLEAKRQAKRDLTKFEESNIRASVKRSHAKQAADIAKADAKARARKESTLAKDISKKFEKERSSKDQTTTRATRPEQIKPTSKQTTITNITKRSQNLVKKAIRLQDKFERGQISKTTYETQMRTIIKQGAEIDALRKNAIEIGRKPKTAPAQTSIASAAIKTRAKVSTTAISASTILAISMAATRIKAIPVAKVITKPIPKAAPKEKADDFVKTSSSINNLIKATIPTIKPPTPKKVKVIRPIAKEEVMPLKLLPLPKARAKPKKVVKKVRIVTKEFSKFQIVNQIAGLESLFG